MNIMHSYQTSSIAQSIPRDWNADQRAEASHVEGIHVIEIFMRNAGMSASRAAEMAGKYTSSLKESQPAFGGLSCSGVSQSNDSNACIHF